MKLSIILPVRNQSAKLLKNLEERILPFFDKTGLVYEVLIESDSSDPENEKMLEEALPKLPLQVKHIPYENTRGKGYAVKRAIEASSGDYVLFMDADLSTDLKAFNAIRPELGKYDAFLASRHSKGSVITSKQTALRRLTSWGSRRLIRMMFHMKGIEDTQCGYKCFRRNVALAMVAHQIISGFAFDVEYVYFLYVNGFKIKTVPVEWANDPDSTVNAFKASKAFYRDLKRIKKNRRHYILSPKEKEIIYAD
jgi:dolichyl-phosphate beta-glucosyltransferase